MSSSFRANSKTCNICAPDDNLADLNVPIWNSFFSRCTLCSGGSCKKKVVFKVVLNCDSSFIVHVKNVDPNLNEYSVTKFFEDEEDLDFPFSDDYEDAPNLLNFNKLLVEEFEY